MMSELSGEKIDIIDYDEDPARFVANALSPAKVVSVTVIDQAARAARVVVPDFQLSLAIGKEGRTPGWRRGLPAGVSTSGVIRRHIRRLNPSTAPATGWPTTASRAPA
ncbi:nusA-like KH domain protein [Mycobacterium xenopi 4042]|uniref:NusA-like KH domain protein n=1 Tax=Mycobacterium xenopi 4042 TaxID=1299334 RepID=X8E860_MYCXE|nr:nusA-like KH domain protein [Mycobacterium xenopi 4042]